MAFTTGDIIIDGNPVANKIIRIIHEYFSRFHKKALALPFKKYPKILEPSNGGNGNRLNTPK